MLTMTKTFFPIIGRLAPGIDEGRAAEMAQRWVPSMPTVTTELFVPDAIRVFPERSMRVGRRDDVRTFLGSLLVVCGLVLLAACANVANHQLGRVALRRREMALRAALGASRSRLLRQIATESALLALATAAVALPLAAAAGSWLASLPNTYLNLPSRVDPVSTAAAIDGRMAGVALLGGFAVTLVLGVLPALASFRDPARAMRDRVPLWSWGRLRPSARQAVLVLQVGLGVVLVVTAALLARSFQRAADVDPEFADPSTLLLARLTPVGRTREEAGHVYEALLAELDDTPGVVSASMSWNAPFAGGIATVRRADDPGPEIEVGGAAAGAGFFATSGIDVVAGEEFGAFGVGPEQVVINRILAERLWPDADPIGRAVVAGGREARVVAVVARERCRRLLGEPSGCLWRSYDVSAGVGTVRVRTTSPAATFIPALEELLARLDPGIVVRAEPLADQIRRTTRAQRVAATASSALALFGIALLAVGFVAVFVAMVRDSTREIAIRMALGATSGRLTARIGGQGLLVLLGGLAIGLCAATLVAARLVGRLYGVEPTDPTSYGLAAAVTLVAGLGAVGFATAEATRTAPAERLRRDG